MSWKKSVLREAAKEVFTYGQAINVLPPPPLELNGHRMVDQNMMRTYIVVFELLYEVLVDSANI